MLTRVRNALDALRVDQAPAALFISSASSEAAAKSEIRQPKPETSTAPAFVKQRPQPKAPREAGDVVLTGPQRRLLNTLAWWCAMGIDAPTSEQVAFAAGYSPTSSSFANTRGALKAAGYVDYPSGGRMSLTSAGVGEAVVPEFEPTVAVFHGQVRAKLGGPQVRLLDPVLVAYPSALTSAELAEAAAYSVTSSSFANTRGSLKALGLIENPANGQVSAASWLFPCL